MFLEMMGMYVCVDISSNECPRMKKTWVVNLLVNFLNFPPINCTTPNNNHSSVDYGQLQLGKKDYLLRKKASLKTKISLINTMDTMYHQFK